MQPLRAKGILSLIGLCLLLSIEGHMPLGASSIIMESPSWRQSLPLDPTVAPIFEPLDSLSAPTGRKPSPSLSPDSLSVDSPRVLPTPSDTLPSARVEIPRGALQWFREVPSSTIAILCAIIPGGGQLYNKQYWKIPVVLGIGTGCAYAISRFGGLYNEYHSAYRDYMGPDPLQHDSWKSFVPPGGAPKDYLKNSNIQGRLKKGTDFYRRNRDLSIIVSALVYLLAVVDAYVDAELADFDISPDLSLWQSPSGQSATGWKFPTVGLQCSIRF